MDTSDRDSGTLESKLNQWLAQKGGREKDPSTYIETPLLGWSYNGGHLLLSTMHHAQDHVIQPPLFKKPEVSHLCVSGVAQYLQGYG